MNGPPTQRSLLNSHQKSGWPIHALFSAHEWGTPEARISPTTPNLQPINTFNPLIEKQRNEWCTRQC